MRFRYFVLLLLSVIMGAGVLLVQTIDFVPYARSPISTHVYWQKNPTLNGVHRRIQDGEDVNAYSEYGWTPIMFAIQTGNTDIVGALVAGRGGCQRYCRRQFDRPYAGGDYRH